jgi:sugar/nucleoside kinase (ribokinase family)
MFDVLVAGEINPDLILSGDVAPVFGQVEKLVDHADLTIGSSSAIFACGASRLGLKTAFVGVCGADIFGQFMLAEMNKRKVDTNHVVVIPDGATGFSVILNQGVDRAILTYPGLIAALKQEDITDEILGQTRHLHVASYFIQDSLRPGLKTLFERAHQLGVSTSIDTNYDPTEKWEGVLELLPKTDIFFPNEKEALSIARTSELNVAIQTLSEKCGIVVVKRGSKGATLCSGGKILNAPSMPVKVIDTVGAGDSFDAGFIYGFIQQLGLEKTLRVANLCGAFSTRGPGGTSSQADLTQVNAYL